MGNDKNRFYGFGEFQLDARRRILSKNNANIALTPRNFDLLLVLIENEGEILSHDDLLEKVWEGTFVEQGNLKNAISVLRRCLGEEASDSTYIRTVPRRGYSFVAPVEIIADDPHVHTTPTNDNLSSNIDISEPGQNGNAEGEISIIRNRLATMKIDSKSISPKTIAIILGLALLIAAGLVAVWTFRSRSAPSVNYDANQVQIFKITSEGNLVGGVASISPDGKYLVYAVREGENVSLWTRQIVTGISRQISPMMHGSVWSCYLTPDEEFIYYVFNQNSDKSKSGVYKISTFGGSAQKISDNPDGSLSISPDGKRFAVFYVTNDLETRIETRDMDGRDPQVVWSARGDLRIWSLRFAPDGRTLLFSIRRQLPDKMVYSIIEIPVGGGHEKVLLPEQEKQIADTIWLPDKQSLMMSVRELNAELRQIWQYFPATGEWKRVTNDNASYRGISATRDGKTLVASQEIRQTTLWASPTGELADLSQIIPSTHYFIDVGIGSNSKIIYSIVENSKEMIGSLSKDGTDNKFLTAGDDGVWVFPMPSRDGQHIAFASLRSGRRQVWTMENDGRNSVQLSQFTTDVYDGRLLSDGKRSILLQLETPQKSMLVLRTEDGEIRPLIQNQSKRWAISPDEKYVASQIQDPQTKKMEVVIVDIETAEVIRKLDFAANRVLRWTTDGKGLAYDAYENGVGKIMIFPVEGGSPKPFVQLKSEEIFSFDWSPDGRTLALIRGNHLTDAVKITVGVNR